MRPRVFEILVFGAALFAGCGKKSDPAYVPPPASVILDDQGHVSIRREIFFVDGVTPPANPTTGAATPPGQNKVRVVRYRVDADPPLPARAVVVMMPGFLGGAGSMDGIARSVVRASTEGDALEAWAIDRRSNLLEDTHGLDVAEVRRDPSLARSYYVDGEPVEGKTFDGFIGSLSWASEWGVETTLEDLRRVVALVPQEARSSRVILLGHSLGAGMVEEYAAWDFAGTPGYEEIAGLVLVDGQTGVVDAVKGLEGKPSASVDRNRYENGGGVLGALGYGTNPGVLTDIRKGDVFFSLPLFGAKALVIFEYTSMQAHWSPNEIAPDVPRDGLIASLLLLSQAPKMTNRAAFGFLFDDSSTPLIFDAVTCGEGGGGPVTPYKNLIGVTQKHPSDPNATYTWSDYDAVSPRENTSIDDFARAWYEGPNLNFSEWYFPQRLFVDVSAAGTLNLAATDWQVTEYGLKAKHGAQIDVPIFAAALAVEGDASAFDALKQLVAPIGAGRPMAGKLRSDPDAFTAVAFPATTHIDGVVGTDRPGSPVADLHRQVIEFIRKQTPTGGVTVPVR